MEKTITVTWKINLDMTDIGVFDTEPHQFNLTEQLARIAAEEAMNLLQKTNTTANVFTVSWNKGEEDVQIYEVDLNELLPCPLCNGDADFFTEAETFKEIIKCTECGCTIKGGTAENARKKWNTRI